MNIVTIVARILLGILFVLAGAMPFFMAPPPSPGLAGSFNQLFYQSHWTLFVGAAQIVIGILLLTNRFVPVALIMLAAFIYNSFAFHITMLPQGLFAPVIVLILGYIVARPYSGLFAPLFRPQPLRTQREP